MATVFVFRHVKLFDAGPPAFSSQPVLLVTHFIINSFKMNQVQTATSLKC